MLRRLSTRTPNKISLNKLIETRQCTNNDANNNYTEINKKLKDIQNALDVMQFCIIFMCSVTITTFFGKKN